MESRCCLGCGKRFQPRPQCPNQRYCSTGACQQVRKNRWQRNKLKTDLAYRENQIVARKRWASAHPGYPRAYRASHPDYVERNRAKQRERDHASHLAKMDASNRETSIPSGRYRLTPVQTSDLAKMDAWMVNIDVVSTGYARTP